MGRPRKPPDNLPAGADAGTAAAFAEAQGIARRLQALMDKTAMDVAAVAAAAGIAESTVYDMLRSRKDVRLPTLVGIASALQVPLASLVSDMPHSQLRQAT